MNKRQSQNMIKKAFENGDIDLHPDKIVRHTSGEKKGSISLRFYYFYRHGQTSQKWADKTQAALDKFYGKGYMRISDHFENWQSWPRDSWFSVTFQPNAAS